MTTSAEAGGSAVSAGAVDLSTASFGRFARFITSELGIKMPKSKATLVQSRLLRRVRDLRMTSVEQYCEYFFGCSNEEERQHFINAITTNKTEFYREPRHFVYLHEIVLPEVRRSAGREFRFKAWSAGCSSGEEPYTLAMVANEYALQHSGFDFAILGTDISTAVLDAAKSAIYEESQAAALPPELRRRYLWQGRDMSRRLVRVVPELRRK